MLPEELTEYAEKGCEVCPNLYYLGGKYGLKVLSGLRVGFLCTPADSGQGAWGRELGKLCDDLPAGSGVDILLTASWPRGVQRGSAGIVYPTQCTSVAVAEAVRALRPRYHFASSVEEAPVFWLRSPYRNQSASATAAYYCGSRKYFTTRFCALAPAFNTAKQRHLYAVKVVPIDKMPFEAEPADTTESPYLLPPDEQEQTFFRKLNESAAAAIVAAGPSGAQPNTTGEAPGEGGMPPAKRMALTPRGALDRPANRGCWFCLSNPEVETHLIAHIGEHNYVTVAKGALCDGHALVVPVEHAPSTMTLSAEARNEMMGIVHALAEAVDGPSVAFELHVMAKKAVHSYVQFCPLPRDLETENIVKAFTTAMAQNGGSFAPMNEEEEAEESSSSSSNNNSREALAQQNYFWFQLPDKTKFIAAPLPPRFPFTFGRAVVAGLLGRPEATDWKACVGSREAEEAMTESLKTILSRALNK